MMHNILEQALSQYAIPYPSKAIKETGFTRWGHNNRYWATPINDGWVFGDYTDGISSYCFPESKSKLSQEEYTIRRNEIERRQKESQIEQAKRHQEAAKKARWIWNKSTPASNEHPYLKRKKVESYGLREYKGSLVVPMYDESETLSSLQFINDKQKGNKTQLFGGKVKGCFYMIGMPKNRIIISEGVATSLALYQALGDAVVVAFSAGNLKPVAEIIRKKYSLLEIIIGADNDAR